MTEKLRPVIARVVIPALVRGDELITKSGCYGELIREARRLELGLTDSMVRHCSQVT